MKLSIKLLKYTFFLLIFFVVLLLSPQVLPISTIGLGIPSALASNSNYENNHLRFESLTSVNDDIVLTVFVKSSCPVIHSYNQAFDRFMPFCRTDYCDYGISYSGISPAPPACSSDCSEHSYTLETGETYTFTFNSTTSWGWSWPYGQHPWNYLSKTNWEHYRLSTLDETDYLAVGYFFSGCDIGQYTPLAYFEAPPPTLTLTWPENDGEISGDFNITGTITQPGNRPLNYFQARIVYENIWDDPSNPSYTVGNFEVPISVTSTQAFTLPIFGLPVSNPNRLSIQLNGLYRDPVTNEITDIYAFNSYGDLNITTFNPTGESNPVNIPDWYAYFSIYSPSISSDGYYHLSVPTSSIEFQYNFPESYKVAITETSNGTTTPKLATTTFSTLDDDLDKRFSVDDFDASTSTPSEVNVFVYNASGVSVINGVFNVMGTTEVQNKGFFGEVQNFIGRMFSAFFLPSQSVLHTMITGYKVILESKIPFSYFTDTKVILDGADLGEATPLPTLTLSLGGSDIELDVFNVPTEITSAPAYTTLYTLMRYVCWFMLLLYIIYKVQTLTAHPN